MGNCGTCLNEPDGQTVSLDRPIGKLPPSQPEPDYTELVEALQSYRIRKQSKIMMKVQEQAEPITEVPDMLTPAAKETLGNLPQFLFNLGLPTGVSRGPVRLPSHAVYLGEWGEDGNQTGRGVKYCPDGSVWTGYWYHGDLHGYGRIIYPSGDYYEGEINFNKRHGHGEYHNQALKSKYDGEWKDDLQHGTGEEWYKDANSFYQGEYKFGCKDGRGKFQWPDGSIYEGLFKENMLDGDGEYLWFDGRKYVGGWKDNKMQGRGLFLWPDGRKYEGDFVDDKKDGQGKYTWGEGKVYEGGWKAGKMHGKATLLDTANGKKQFLVFDNGRIL